MSASYKTPLPFLAVAAVALIFQGTVFAQTPPRPPANAPDIGTAIKGAEGARPVPVPQRVEPNIVPEAAVPSSEAQGGVTIFVSGFKLEDAEHIPEAEILAVLAPYINRNLTMQQLEEATSKVTELYRQRGYPVARALLPKQRADAGVITIRVVVGKYGPSSIENKSLIRDSVVEKTLRRHLKEGRSVHQADLERAVLLIGDLPGAAQPPRLGMDAGQKPGTTEFFMEALPENRFGGFLMSDNLGSRYTGRWRFGGGANVNSPSGMGDKLSVFALSTENAGLVNGTVNYAIPLGYDGLRAEVGYSHVQYELGKEFKDMDATGKSDTVDATLSYPILRASNRNLTAHLNYAHKQMEDEYDAFDWKRRKHSNVAKLGLKFENWTSLFGKPFYSRAEGGVTFGKMAMRADVDDRKTRGNFSYLTLGLAGNVSLTNSLSLSVAASGQQSFGKNLDSSEQFSVTGAGGVREYREVITGDNGYLLDAELNYKLPAFAQGISHSVGVFANVGYWEYEKKPFPDKHSDTLSGGGLGYSIGYKYFTLKTQLMRSFGAYPNEVKRESRTWLSVQGTASF
ncbi:MAG: hypothetical protein LBG78_02985 [Azoarcus sp.]|jgi:hemolysin activation/secretion protein|nr:hypothetical protein [Azoarcus sp.]